MRYGVRFLGLVFPRSTVLSRYLGHGTVQAHWRSAHRGIPVTYNPHKTPISPQHSRIFSMSASEQTGATATQGSGTESQPEPSSAATKTEPELPPLTPQE